MNRFKRELRRKGVKLKDDYMCLPFALSGNNPFSPGYISVEDVFVDSKRATVTIFYNVIDETIRMDRNGKLVDADTEKEVKL